jgi:hypothetical protein
MAADESGPAGYQDFSTIARFAHRVGVPFAEWPRAMIAEKAQPFDSVLTSFASSNRIRVLQDFARDL